MWTAWKSTRPSSDWLFPLFSVVVAATCVWVLMLPLFPSQDGPLHLYYAHIFGRLLAGDAGRYGAYFHIGSYMPPYAVYYYALVALQHVMPLETADQVLVCCSIVLVAFGFRYLARRIGPGGDVAAFVVLPVLLSWPLMMGFVNFMLSFGLALWAAGLWARFGDAPGLRRQVCYVGLLYVMAVTHPIPLAVLLVGCGLDLCLRAVLLWRQRVKLRSLMADLLPRLVCLVLALPACVYVQHFVVKDVLLQHHPVSLHRALVDNTQQYLQGVGLLVFPQDSAWTTLYRLGVAGVLVAAAVLGGRHAWRQLHTGRLDGPATWFCISAVLLAVFPVFPDEVNGAYFVARRLVLGVYLCVALSATGVRPGARATALVLVCAGLSFVAVGLGAVRIGAAARRIATLADSPYTPPGEVGVVEQVNGTHLDKLTYRPYFWAAAFFFRRHDLIVYNAAWLNEPQIPLKLNAGSGLLHTHGDDTVPTTSMPATVYALGQLWNPANASFFVFEERKPPMTGTAQEMRWAVAVPVRGLEEARCRDADWYCIAVRPAVAGNRVPAGLPSRQATPAVMQR